MLVMIAGGYLLLFFLLLHIFEIFHHKKVKMKARVNWKGKNRNKKKILPSWECLFTELKGYLVKVLDSDNQSWQQIWVYLMHKSSVSLQHIRSTRCLLGDRKLWDFVFSVKSTDRGTTLQWDSSSVPESSITAITLQLNKLMVKWPMFC